MVLYQCPKCNMVFNRKSNYDTHINKKFDCGQKSKPSQNAFQNIPKYSKNGIF